MIWVVVVGSITESLNVDMLPSELMKTVSACAGIANPTTAATATKPNNVFFMVSPPRGYNRRLSLSSENNDGEHLF
jgi:hypothetical protein